MRPVRSVSLGVVAVLLLSLVAVFAITSVLPSRLAAYSGPNCTAPSGELIVNGGFESPAIPGGSQLVTPDGWTSPTNGVRIFRNDPGESEGRQFVSFNVGSPQLSQLVESPALSGALLTLSFDSLYGEGTVTINDQTTPVSVNPVTYLVPVGTTAVTITFTGGSSSSTGLDAVSLTASCPAAPTATATTAPTATATTAPTSTTVPTATATIQPTAGPTMRPTARPRTTATVPATATSSVPTVRPTARPRVTPSARPSDT